MNAFEIIGGKKLKGEIIPQGAKNEALQILSAVEKNARRVLVGPDAKFLDKVVRLLGASYQVLIIRQMRKMSKPRTRARTAA